MLLKESWLFVVYTQVTADGVTQQQQQQSISQQQSAESPLYARRTSVSWERYDSGLAIRG
jgi:hypothetical protein